MVGGGYFWGIGDKNNPFELNTHFLRPRLKVLIKDCGGVPKKKKKKNIEIFKEEVA